jgi:hypothetical protein
MRFHLRIFVFLAAITFSSGPGYARNMPYREHTPVWIRVDSTADRLPLLQQSNGERKAMYVVEATLMLQGNNETGPTCRAGNVDFPALARELQDEDLLTWSHIDTGDAKNKVVQATFGQPVTLGQAVFDFLIYNGECFAPRGNTRLQLLNGGTWKYVALSHLENWSEAESMGAAQRMGRMRWIYDLDGHTCSGFRLMFSKGLENSVICTAVGAFDDHPIKEHTQGSRVEKRAPTNGENLLPQVPYELSLSSGKGDRRATSVALPLEFTLHPEGRIVSLRLSQALMLSRLELGYESEGDVGLSMEMFLEDERITIGAPRLLQNAERAVFTLAPTCVDRVDFLFSGNTGKKAKLVSLAAILEDEAARSLEAIADASGDLWANRLLASGEPNYANSAALMLPRRDYRTVVGCADDGDETAIAWNGTLFLRRRGDPRGSLLERFFAFRLNGENFGKDFNALRGGWTDGRPKPGDGSLPERIIRYDKDGVSAIVRIFAGVGKGGGSRHLLWMEVSLHNQARQQREGSFEVATGLRRCGKSGRIGLYWDLPVPDAVIMEGQRLLRNELGKPILRADRPFELGGTKAEPACRFDYKLSPGQSHSICLVAVTDSKSLPSNLPEETLAEARIAFADYWNCKLTSEMRITLPEKRLQRIYPHLLAQCMIIPDHGVPMYGSYFYEDTLCVEEIWPTVALAQFGFFDEAERHAQSVLEIAARDQLSRHKQYRKGLAPCCAWSVYQYSRDRDFLERIMPLMRVCCEYIVEERSKTMTLRDGEKTGYHGLLPRFVYGGDVEESAYSLYANACAWRGLRDSSLAARTLGDTALADRWSDEAVRYHKDIMAVVERVTDRDSIPIFTPLSIGRNARDRNDPFPAGDPTPRRLHQDRISSYWALFAGLFLETGVFDPASEYTTGMLDTLKKKAGLWDGQVRFAYQEEAWDPHYGYGLHRMWQRRDERGLFLTAFYGFLANNMSRDSWVHGEVSNVFPLHTGNFAQRQIAYDKIWRQRDYKNSEPLSSGPGIVLRDLRDMLVSEQRDAFDEISGGLCLLRNAPGAWLVDGEDIVVERAPTAYGTLSYRVQSELRRKRRITVSLQLDSREPVLIRVFSNPIHLNNLLTAKWSHATDSRHGVNWTEAKVKGRAEVQLQF